jgi:hypothetical protein
VAVAAQVAKHFLAGLRPVVRLVHTLVTAVEMAA